MRTWQLLTMMLVLLAPVMACVSTNTTNIANLSLNVDAGQCYNVSDGSGSWFIFNGPSQIALNMSANSTTSGPWGTASCTGNATVLNVTNVTNVSGSCNAATATLFGNQTVVINNATVTSVCNSTIVQQVINTTTVQNVSTCNLTLNFTASNTTQTYIDLNKQLAIYIQPVPASWCYENRNESATNLTVFRSEVANDTFICAPQPVIINQSPACANATAPVCPTGVYNLAPAQLQVVNSSSGSLVMTCANQTSVVQSLVELNRTVQNNVTCNRTFSIGPADFCAEDASLNPNDLLSFVQHGNMSMVLAAHDAGWQSQLLQKQSESDMWHNNYTNEVDAYNALKTSLTTGGSLWTVIGMGLAALLGLVGLVGLVLAVLHKWPRWAPKIGPAAPEAPKNAWTPSEYPSETPPMAAPAAHVPEAAPPDRVVVNGKDIQDYLHQQSVTFDQFASQVKTRWPGMTDGQLRAFWAKYPYKVQ